MKRITIKVGSTFFIDKNGRVNTPNISALVNQIATIKKSGVDVCLVTSGAIAVGVKKMQLSKKPTATNKKQALAAIGQMSLMQIYEQEFEKHDLKCAQILLNHDDFGNRDRINNLAATLNALFDYGVVPVVNENDAANTNEIKVGDNDTLSAMTSLIIQSNLLVLISDIDGLYTANPKRDENAKLIPFVDKIDQGIISLAKAPDSEFGTGGMATKIKAAQITTDAGIPLMIVNKTKLENLFKAISGENLGTYFKQSDSIEHVKKCWIKYIANIKGDITCDDGAVNAIKNRKSLLSCGIISVSGSFETGDAVNVLNEEGKIIAKGIVNTSKDDVKTLLKNKNQTQLILHANNIALLG